VENVLPEHNTSIYEKSFAATFTVCISLSDTFSRNYVYFLHYYNNIVLYIVAFAFAFI